MADLTAEDCWSAIYSLADEYLVDKIPPHVIVQLMATGFVALGANGLPELTNKGWTAHSIAKSGEGRVEEIDSLPPKIQ